MARYQYVARDENANKLEGIIEASSNLAVITKLREQNLIPVRVCLAGQKESVFSLRKEKSVVKKGKVNLKELAIFTRQISAMLAAGVPIVDAFDDLSSQTSNRYFSYILKMIRKDIQEGSNLSGALSKYPKVYTSLYVALIKAGEESGNLAEVMDELAKNLEDQIALISKVKQALSYPAIVSIFFIVVVSFVFLYLLPKFQEIFTGFGAQLPKFTVITLSISKFLVSALPFLISAIVLLIILLVLFQKTPAGRQQIDRAKLGFPLFGQIMLKVSLSRIAGSLATLIAGGVTIIHALEIVSKTSGNAVIEQTIEKVRQGVIKGSLIGSELKKYRIFPVLFVRMVIVGEDTGKLDEMLNRVAKFFRDEVDATLNILASILEPILIISLGIVVGIVVLAIYLPIFNLAGAVK